MLSCQMHESVSGSPSLQIKHLHRGHHIGGTVSGQVAGSIWLLTRLFMKSRATRGIPPAIRILGSSQTCNAHTYTRSQTYNIQLVQSQVSINKKQKRLNARELFLQRGSPGTCGGS